MENLTNIHNRLNLAVAPLIVLSVIRDERGLLARLSDGRILAEAEIQPLISNIELPKFNGVEVVTLEQVDSETIKRILKNVRPDTNDQWLQLNAQMRELMLATASTMAVVRAMIGTLNAQQQAALAPYIAQIDASLVKAQQVSALRDEGTAFKNANAAKLK